MSVTYIVTNSADSGAGSLRSAIIAANSNPGPDMIHFDIASGGTEIQVHSSTAMAKI